MIGNTYSIPGLCKQFEGEESKIGLRMSATFQGTF